MQSAECVQLFHLFIFARREVASILSLFVADSLFEELAASFPFPDRIFGRLSLQPLRERTRVCTALTLAPAPRANNLRTES